MDDAQAFLKYVHDHASGQSEETLRRAFAILRDAVRHNEVKAALAFAEGDQVQFRGRRGLQLNGTVTKVSHATLTVRASDGQFWRVSPGLCTRWLPKNDESTLRLPLLRRSRDRG